MHYGKWLIIANKEAFGNNFLRISKISTRFRFVYVFAE